MPPRMRLIDRVLEAAEDAGDVMVINACRRLWWANIRGWRRHHDPADMALVRDFNDVAVERLSDDLIGND